jgi:hypothetical protein
LHHNVFRIFRDFDVYDAVSFYLWLYFTVCLYVCVCVFYDLQIVLPPLVRLRSVDGFLNDVHYHMNNTTDSFLSALRDHMMRTHTGGNSVQFGSQMNLQGASQMNLQQQQGVGMKRPSGIGMNMNSNNIGRNNPNSTGMYIHISYHKMY